MWWLALAGAAFGIASAIGSARARQQQLEQQKKMAWQQYLIQSEAAQNEFSINKNTALENAGIAKTRLGESVGQSMDSFNLGLLSQAYQTQDAQIATQGQVGASLAAEAASGVRGSASGQLMRDYAEQGLARSLEVQDRGNDLSLQSMLSQATNANQDINREIASWGEGGYRTQLFQNQQEANKSLAELGQSNFDWQIDAASPSFFDVLGGAVSGASAGFGLGQSISGAMNYKGSGSSAMSAAGNGGSTVAGVSDNYNAIRSSYVPADAASLSSLSSQNSFGSLGGSSGNTLQRQWLIQQSMWAPGKTYR
jgi:hypothetical protein